MGDFDWSQGYQLAAGILFPMALVGFLCNVSVVVFLNSMPSLKNSFGSLTFSQVSVDSVHQLLLAFFLAQTIYLRKDWMYEISHHFGFATLLAYQLCCLSHVCLSINRFVAVYAPLAYSKIQQSETNQSNLDLNLIEPIGILSTFSVDCWFYLPFGTWIYTFKDNPACNKVKWFGDFTLNSISVLIVAILDVACIIRVHGINMKQNDAVSAQRRSRELNLVYQAALQGIFFITELVTYFILSSYVQNKWQAYGLTTISWCLVNGMDG
ncbi:hypothetical protein PENTCL1PPCAC_15672, partial [Pristionchus entomophagus]